MSNIVKAFFRVYCGGQKPVWNAEEKMYQILRDCRQEIGSPTRQARSVEVGVSGSGVAKGVHLGTLAKTRRRKVAKKKKRPRAHEAEAGEPAELTAVEIKKRQKKFKPTAEDLCTRYKSRKPAFGVDELRARNKVILKKLKKDYPDFVKWFDSWQWKGGFNLIDSAVLEIIEPHYYRVYIFSERYDYAIRVKSDYLACECGCRQPYAGETWTRGRDLADGSYTEETWLHILGDIAAHEMVRLGK